MQILFIRHADPDYEHDSLTKEGVREAKALASYLENVKIDRYYCSTLGRAKKTASYTLEKKKTQAEYCSWLQEFRGRCEKPNRQGIVEYCWDWLPADWTSQSIFYDKDHWFDAPVFKDTNVKSEAVLVTSEFDKLLASLGYVRDGQIYRAEKPNTDTIAIFCHLGVQSVMLSHLIGTSPMIMWHGFAQSPSSITKVVTEEREEGKACFRILEMGAVPHLAVKKMEPVFAARFCECYSIKEQRH